MKLRSRRKLLQAGRRLPVKGQCYPIRWGEKLETYGYEEVEYTPGYRRNETENEDDLVRPGRVVQDTSSPMVLNERGEAMCL
jgi:hypothetical protein